MSKDTDAWMPLYVADYIKDTRHLSTIEHGAYFLLIMHAWTSEGLIPLDEVRIARIAGLEAKEWKGSRDVLLAFFVRTDAGYRHKRIDGELARAAELVEQRRAAGRASAEARKSKRNSNGGGTGGSTRQQREANERSTSVATEPPTSGQRSGRPIPTPKEEEKASRVREREAGPPGNPLEHRVIAAAGFTHPLSNADRQQLSRWRGDGIDIDEDVIPVLRRLAARQAERGSRIATLSYADNAVREQQAADRRELEHFREVSERYGAAGGGTA